MLVLLGNGNGTFQAKHAYGAGNEPTSVALYDLNGDGKCDILTADTSTTTASVLLGNGNGTFQAKYDYGTGTQPRTATAADVNGDTKLDLIVADHASPGYASVLLGNGNGTFQAKHDYSTATYAMWVRTADVNHDGVQDILRVCSKSLCCGPSPWSLVPKPIPVLRPGQPTEHQLNHADPDLRLAGISQVFIILAVNPAPTQPAEGSLHHPPPRQQLKPSVPGRSADDLNHIPPVLRDPSVQGVIVVLGVRPQLPQARERFAQSTGRGPSVPPPHHPRPHWSRPRLEATPWYPRRYDASDR